MDLAAVAPKLVLGDLPPWRAEESSEYIHDCIGVAGACLHSILAGISSKGNGWKQLLRSFPITVVEHNECSCF